MAGPAVWHHVDLATLIGLVGAAVIIAASIALGDGPLVFVNLPSALIVFGGSLFVVLAKFSLTQFTGAVAVAMRAFTLRLPSTEEAIAELLEIAQVARKQGVLALESRTYSSPYLEAGARLLVDGESRETLQQFLERERLLTLDHHRWGAKVFSAFGDVGPAMGMLLLSFSEMDKAKFKQIAGELSQAFGVQREVPSVEIPKGTSAVFDKFSPGRPEPTVIDSVRQQTSTDAPQLATHTTAGAAAHATVSDVTATTEAALRDALAVELGQARLQLESSGTRITLRVEENGSFASGSADVTPAFDRLLAKMAQVLARVPGTLTIEGHTDDIPIKTARFTSNWDLSAARAAAVANAMLRHASLAPGRLREQGHAETHPRQPNDTVDHRAGNRRVEVIVDQGGDSGAIQVELDRLRRSSPDSTDVATR